MEPNFFLVVLPISIAPSVWAGEPPEAAPLAFARGDRTDFESSWSPVELVLRVEGLLSDELSPLAFPSAFPFFPDLAFNCAFKESSFLGLPLPFFPPVFCSFGVVGSPAFFFSVECSSETSPTAVFAPADFLGVAGLSVFAALGLFGSLPCAFSAEGFLPLCFLAGLQQP